MSLDRGSIRDVGSTPLLACKLVLLLASGIGLFITFPEQWLITLVVIAALFLDEFAHSNLRPFLWALIGSAVAYLAMTVSVYSRQFAFSYHVQHVRRLLSYGHHCLRLTAVFAPVMTVAKHYPLGGRRLALVTICSLSAGGLGHSFSGRSTNWTETLRMEYSDATSGCCIGAVAAALAICIYDTIQSLRKEAVLASNAGCGDPD